MRIEIKDMKGNTKSIDVKWKWYNFDVKRKYGNINITLKFEGDILDNNQTISSYEIEDGNTIIACERCIGGETGSAAKGLADPTKKDPKRIKTVTDGPFY